jgi:signal transduction histidine kinase
LRTPLTALRLQVETATDGDDLVSLLADVERMEAAVNVMIEEARSPSRSSDKAAIADLGAVVDHRAAFWQVLADEQGRPTGVVTEPGDHQVPVSADALGALVDVLIGNVFTHTDEGVGYLILVRTTEDGHAELIVEDAGPGFTVSGALRRGHSSSGSTGLGLDIVARTAERSGGTVRLGESSDGGARVVVVFGKPEQIGVGEPRQVATSPRV